DAAVNVAIGQLTTVSFTIEGKSSSRISANTGTTDQFIAGATYTSPATHPTLHPIGVQTIRVGGADYAASSIAVTWNNNAQAREQLGNLGPSSIARRQFAVSGRVSAYFDGFGD